MGIRTGSYREALLEPVQLSVFINDLQGGEVTISELVWGHKDKGHQWRSAGGI